MNKQDTKVTLIGGGSGSSVILRGLKKYTDQITAIVTVADDGGSSGKLREDLGMLPPGDVRNAIVALSNAEPMMAELMQHRFEKGEFKGHSLGNMLIAGLVEIKGGFEEALTCVHDIFAVTGRVLPVSLDDIVLKAILEDGYVVTGESRIPKVVRERNTKIKDVLIEPQSAIALPTSVDAILKSDVIMIGPGSLYTSIMPNLLINSIRKAVIKSKAKKIVVLNLMTQPGETDNMTAFEHLSVITDLIGPSYIHAVLVNNSAISETAKTKYAAEHAHMIEFNDKQRGLINDLGIKIIEDRFVEETIGYVRHNANKVAETILNLVDTKRYYK